MVRAVSAEVVTLDGDDWPTVDLDRNRLHYAGKTISLGPRSCDIAALLVQHRGRVVSFERLAIGVYQDRNLDEPKTAASCLRVAIAGMRKKLKTLGLEIVCYRERGYELLIQR